MLDFTCLDAVMFVKVARTLFDHSMWKQKHCVLLELNTYFPLIKCCLNFGQGFLNRRWNEPITQLI